MKVQRLLFMVAISVALFSCGNGNTYNNGDWVSRAPYGGYPRGEAVAFSIGDTGYVGTGFGSNSTYFGDFWGFNPITGLWTQEASLPGLPRALAIGFATTKYGYCGTGVYGVPGSTVGLDFLSDFWRYDPTSGTWDSMPAVPFGTGYGRDQATAWSVPDQGIGGLLGGADPLYPAYNDIYTFTESTNTWTKGTAPVDPVRGGLSFTHTSPITHQEVVYFVTGMGNTALIDKFWAWTPSTSSNASAWQQNNFAQGGIGPRRIANVTDQSYDAGYHIVRQNAVAFQMNNNGVPKAYVSLGTNGSNLNDCWEYDFATDTWTPKTPYPPGQARAFAIALTLRDSGYVGLGTNAGINAGSTSNFFSDFTQFYPNLPYNVDDYSNN